MALDDLLISTGVDQLIRLAKERGKIELSAAARELKQPLRTVEDWAHVLEEEGLVQIEYKLTRVFLVWKGPTRDYVLQKGEKLDAAAEQALGEIERLVSKVDRGGTELALMQQELERISSVAPMTPSELARIKTEISELDSKYSLSIKAAQAKLDKLKKKLEASGFPAGGAGGKAANDIGKEMEILHKFESTLQSQLDDTETFFEAFETRLEDFRKRIEENREDSGLMALKAELEEAKSLKAELSGAIDAISEEQSALSAKYASVEKKLADYGEGNSVAGAKKKIAELRKMGEDARRQKEAIAEQFAEALTLVKKQSFKLQDIAGSQSEAEKKLAAIKDDYIDVSEEIARANEELAKKQKLVSERISGQLQSLSSGQSRVSKDEVQKVSFLLRELKREHALLEENVRNLLKQTQVLKMESSPLASGKAAARQEGGGRQEQAIVERVKLSQEEEGEFERKRDELRSLIRRMWEDTQGAAPPS